MLGSHNSFTFLEAKHHWMEWFSFLWRCQNENLHDQYKSGVRFFDIRLARNKDGYWSPCHGWVKLKGNGNILDYLDSIMNAHRGTKVRLICEHAKDAKYFIDDINNLISTKHWCMEIVTEAIIKKNWQVIYQSHPIPIKDLTYVPWHSGMSFWENIKNFKFSTIKKCARLHNSKITNDIINNPNIIYFIDYVK